MLKLGTTLRTVERVAVFRKFLKSKIPGTPLPEALKQEISGLQTKELIVLFVVLQDGW